MKYQPRPFDTTRIELPAELVALVELLAENNHDVWAAQRLADGWRWGPERHDERKEHPGLVKYADLAESEKAYDRATAVEAIKFLLAHGYEIAPIAGRASDPRVAEATEESPEAGVPSPTPDESAITAERHLAAGDPLLAYEALRPAREEHPDHLRLRQLEALALTRCGATDRARELVAELRGEGHRDEETLGIFARVQKDLWARCSDPRERLEALHRAFDAYADAYRETGGYWTGINAATLALALGETDRARALARASGERCRVRLRDAIADDTETYWVYATLGEAALIAGDEAEASRWYREAAATACTRFGLLSTTRRNAAWILDALGRDGAYLEDVLRLPPVALFSSVGVEAGDREYASVEKRIVACLDQALAGRETAIGFASLCGIAELIFLEAVLARRGPIHVIVPYDFAQLAEDMERACPQLVLRPRIERVISAAARVVETSRSRTAQHESALAFARAAQRGLALLYARRLATEILEVTPGIAPPAGSPAGRSDLMPVRGLLFADVVGYSKLTDAQIPAFVSQFLGEIAGLIGRKAPRAQHRDTWGDGIFVVLPTASDAGRLGIELCEMVESIDWEPRGLPSGMAIRVAVHAGPVYAYDDPVTGGSNYAGSHVNEAARIEPVTPPGYVYGSEMFAAMAVYEGATDLACEPVGRMVLAKRYAVAPTYHVRREVAS